MTRPCQEMQDRIAESLTADLSAQEVRELDHHLSQCPACRAYGQAMRGDHERLAAYAATMGAAVNGLPDRVIDALDRAPRQRPPEKTSAWRTIMKSRIAQLATAATILLATAIWISSLNGTDAWAETVRALQKVDDARVTSTYTLANGEVWEWRGWIKGRVMMRSESPRKITVDDGVNRLTLDREDKTARLGDSWAGHDNFMEHDDFEVLLMFQGEQTPYKARELPGENGNGARVYEVTYREFWKGKAWVDANTHLPTRIEASFLGKYAERYSRLEVTYRYDPIPVETFSTTIPAGYTELPRLERSFISGKVIDERGNGVSGAEVYTSEEAADGKTNDRGEFVIKLPPNEFGNLDFPLFIRALRNNDPRHVAWTVVRDPEDEDVQFGERGTAHEWGRRGTHVTGDESGLRKLIRGQPGEIVFKRTKDIFKDGDDTRRAWGVRGIVLEMAPASVITGRVTDSTGQPIRNARIQIGHIDIRSGWNRVHIGNTGAPGDDEQAFAHTDDKGHYTLGSLPRPWTEVSLRASAVGYATVERRLEPGESGDFELVKADITVRGTVIDNHGEPLVGRDVEVHMEDRDFDEAEAWIDEEGKFVLANCPRVPGLMLRVRSGSERGDWGEIPGTKNRKFIHYLDTDVTVDVEPGKTEYNVSIVPRRPDITIELVIRDAAGKPLVGIPIGLGDDDVDTEWATNKLWGTTDDRGRCRITEVPRGEQTRVWVGHPRHWLKGGWERNASKGLLAAIAAFKEYRPVTLPVELVPNRRTYRLEVALRDTEEQQESNRTRPGD